MLEQNDEDEDDDHDFHDYQIICRETFRNSHDNDNRENFHNYQIIWRNIKKAFLNSNADIQKKKNPPVGKMVDLLPPPLYLGFQVDQLPQIVGVNVLHRARADLKQFLKITIHDN